MDAVAVLMTLGLVVVTFFWLGLSYWGWFWVSLALLLAGWELAAKFKTGKTLSQQIWKLEGWRQKVAVGLIAIAGLGLVVHLAWR